MLAPEAFEVKLYFAHVFFDVTRRNEGTCAGDGFGRIVYPEKHDGYLGFQGDVVEAFFPLRVGFSGTFGRNGQVELAGGSKTPGHLVNQRILFAAVDGDTSHSLEHQVEREEEPFLFHHEMGVAPQRTIEELADEQVPIRGMGSGT